MSLIDTDDIIIPAEALEYIEKKEEESGGQLLKFEVIELFFEWLRAQDKEYIVEFIRKALSNRP